jgi:AraC-like DNA-binding protein
MIARMDCTILQEWPARLVGEARAWEACGMHSMADLSALILRHTPGEGVHASAVPCLSLIRADAPTLRVPAVYEASICLIAQGAKHVALGGEGLVYDAAHFLLVSVDLPLVGHVTQARPDAPYLCCKIDFDHAMLAELVLAEGEVGEGHPPVLASYPVTPGLVDAAVRLVRLLERPAAIPTLAPLIEREIMYDLLTGPHGAVLRHMAAPDSRLAQVRRAIATIRDGFDRRLRIGEVAAAAGMSASSLHAHFKAVTRMTPLEYQKQLRLQEARRLMLSQGANAGSAGFAVGYDSPSQFSREYHRLFGAPPRRDVERLQGASGFVGAV